MNNLIVFLAAFSAYLIGYYDRDIRDRVKALEARLKALTTPSKPVETISMSTAEPMTALQLAALEEDERIKALNPGMYT